MIEVAGIWQHTDNTVFKLKETGQMTRKNGVLVPVLVNDAYISISHQNIDGPAGVVKVESDKRNLELARTVTALLNDFEPSANVAKQIAEQLVGEFNAKTP